MTHFENDPDPAVEVCDVCGSDRRVWTITSPDDNPDERPRLICNACIANLYDECVGDMVVS